MKFPGGNDIRQMMKQAQKMQETDGEGNGRPAR